VPDSETRIWAVQVASFKDAERAVKLREQLRLEGYEAFLSTLRRDDEVLHRVAVGPLLSETDAQQMRDALTLIVEQPARLMAFTN
jgi:cell division septation protein DedD